MITASAAGPSQLVQAIAESMTRRSYEEVDSVRRPRSPGLAVVISPRRSEAGER
jgi:hypothetical protein